MNEMMVLLMVALVIAAVVLSLGGRRGIAQAPCFKAKPFLTANESEFLKRLEAAAPELRFHAQVAMAALIDPAVARKGNGRDYWRMRNMFNQKIIDYVAQRRDSGEIVAIIELDDRSHNIDKDGQRDAMLQQAGYRTIRWQAKCKPSAAEISAALAGLSAATAMNIGPGLAGAGMASTPLPPNLPQRRVAQAAESGAG